MTKCPLAHLRGRDEERCSWTRDLRSSLWTQTPSSSTEAGRQTDWHYPPSACEIWWTDTYWWKVLWTCSYTVRTDRHRHGNTLMHLRPEALLSVHCIGQNINSRQRPTVRPSVRPASVDKMATSLTHWSSPNLEHSFPEPRRRNGFLNNSIGSGIRACATINRLPLTNVQVWRNYKRIFFA